MPQYVVLQVALKEKISDQELSNLPELEKIINEQAAKGYRLQTITTALVHVTGLEGGDKLQATMVFEKL